MTHQEKGFYLDLLLYLFVERKPIKDAKHIARILNIDPRTSAKLWAKICHKFESNQHGSTHQLVTKIINNSGRIKGLEHGAYGGGFSRQEQEQEKEEETARKDAYASRSTLSVLTPPKINVQYQKILDLYHKTLPMLKRVKILTDNRKNQIRLRCQNEFPDLDTWQAYFEDIAKSKFLIGQCDSPVNGRRVWQADIDWLLKPGNIAKVSEGKYHG